MLTINHTVNPGNPALAQFILSVTSALTIALLLWIVTTIRRFVKKFMSEHDWLIKTTNENTEAIKRILEAQEKRTTRPTTRRKTNAL